MMMSMNQSKIWKIRVKYQANIRSNLIILIHNRKKISPQIKNNCNNQMKRPLKLFKNLKKKVNINRSS